MIEEEINTFKSLFSKFCREEINKGNCGDPDSSCQFCPVNKAYTEIFDTLEKESEGEPEEDTDEIF